MRWWIGGILAVGLGLWLLRPFGNPDVDRQETAQAVEMATQGSGAGTGPAAPGSAESAEGNQSLSRSADREIFQTTIQRALRERVDKLPVGERIVTLGRWFVGAPYTPQTLELRPERLVVNLREFDCVTYVETMLAMARVLNSRQPTFEDFLEELRRIRYRDGRIDGYASRLHYFSEWIRDNEEMGIVRDVTLELGGIPSTEPIGFMSANREQYDALEDPATLTRIVAIEERLSAAPRHYVPESRIAEVAPGIRDGDVIAITSALRGLDVAHTGFALWIDGRLHFMNVPLVGTDVRISELPLAERIARIDGQDGIMVARPLER